LRIWIDADACPRDVKEVVYRAAQRTQRAVVVVANQPIFVPRSPLVRLERVGGGLDVADDHIVANAEKGDLAITADIPLAARLVEKGILVIDPRGDVYDEENVRERLSVRDFMAGIREAGVNTGGSSAWGPRDKQRFADALDRTLRASR
jgi:hypothetical protein